MQTDKESWEEKVDNECRKNPHALFIVFPYFKRIKNKDFQHHPELSTIRVINPYYTEKEYARWYERNFK